MALLLRFSAVKLGEGLASGRKSDLSLDVSMVETGASEQDLAPTSTAPIEEGLSPLRDQCLAI